MSARTFQFTAVLMLLAIQLEAQVQVNRQIWMDYNVAYPFANVWTADAEVSYQTLISGGDKWRSIQFTPGIQRNMGARIDLFASTPVYFTVQSSSYSTVETRFAPGMKFIMSANRRIESRATLRYDFRAVKTTGGDWQFSNRSRIGMDMTVAMNHPTIYNNKLWYLMMEGELFVVLDQNIDERFANLRKLRMGMGYRLNYRNRYEFSYQVHKSRTTIDTPYDTRDTIFRVRWIMVLNAPKAPAPRSN
jgi:hypothetical protein